MVSATSRPSKVENRAESITDPPQRLNLRSLSRLRGPEAHEAIHAKASALLSRAISAMREVHFELDANEASGVVAAFNAARVAGLDVSGFAVALVDVLKRQLAETFEGMDDHAAPARK